MAKLTIEYQEHPKQEDVEVLGDGIVSNAFLKKGMSRILRFAFFLKDEKGTVLGGCKGVTIYGSVYTDMLWVHEDLRGKGFGTQLLEKAEELGRTRGCTFATINTMDFEALPFYQKSGYEIEFVRSGYEKDTKLIFLRKSL